MLPGGYGADVLLAEICTVRAARVGTSATVPELGEQVTSMSTPGMGGGGRNETHST